MELGLVCVHVPFPLLLRQRVPEGVVAGGAGVREQRLEQRELEEEVRPAGEGVGGAQPVERRREGRIRL